MKNFQNGWDINLNLHFFIELLLGRARTTYKSREQVAYKSLDTWACSGAAAAATGALPSGVAQRGRGGL